MHKRRQILLLTLSAVFCVASVTGMCVVLHRRSAQTFTPPEFEAQALAGTPEVPEALGYAPVEAENAFTAGICGRVVAQDMAAQVYFTNYSENSVWLKLRILDGEGNTLGETGLLRPGEYVQAVTLSKLPEDGAPIGLKIMAYEPETYYSAGAVTLNTAFSAQE